MRRLYLYGILSRLYFHLPILLVFFIFQEIGIVGGTALLALYGLAMTLGSWLAARLPRRMVDSRVMALGEVAKAAGVLSLACAAPGQFWYLLLGQALAGVGFGFTAGRESHLLRHIVRPERVAAEQGKLQSCLHASNFVAGVAGAVMYQSLHWLPFVLAAATSLVAAVVVLPLGGTDREHAVETTTSVRPGRQRLGWMVYYVVTRSIGFALYLAVLPLLLQQLGLSVWLFGTALGIFTLAAFVSARYALPLIERFGETRLTGATVVSLFVSICLFGFTHDLIAAFVGLFLLGFGLGCARPLGLRGLNLSTLTPPARAWLLFTQERIYGVGNAILIVVSGIGLAVTNLNFAAVLTGYAILYAAFVVTFVFMLGRSDDATQSGNMTGDGVLRLPGESR